MRRQDELLALYPGQDVPAAKFILSQTEELGLAFDSEELLDFLHREAASERPEVQHQAQFSLMRFLPGFVEKRWALSVQAAGVWSRRVVQGADRIQRLVLEPEPDPAETARYHAAFLTKAEPIAAGLISILDSRSDPQCVTARLALARYPVASALARLQADCESAPERFDHLLPFALVARATGATARLEEIVTRHHAAHPEHLLAVAHLPPERAAQMVLALGKTAGPAGRANLAQVVGALEGVDHEALVRFLVGFREAWVAAHALHALERTGDPRVLGAVLWLYDASRNPFLKRLAVRAAGGLEGEDAILFCLRVLQQDGETVAAQALESLVRLGADPAVVRRVAAPYLQSASIHVRVNALLAGLEAPEGAPSPVEPLLLSADPVSRLEAAFCLGYLHDDRSLATLRTLIDDDPVIPVRLQALKSLSRYPATDVLPVLVELASSPVPEVAITAGRMLARFDGVEAAAACEGLIAACRRPANAAARGVLLSALGTVAGRSGYQHALEVLSEGLASPDPQVVLGAVKGWNALGCPAAPEVAERLEALVGGGDPRVRPRALLGLFQGGQPDALARLAGQLYDASPAVRLPAIDTALELGLLSSGTCVWKRFPALVAPLEAVEPAPELSSFVKREVVPAISAHSADAPPPRKRAGEAYRVRAGAGIKRLSSPVPVPAQAGLVEHLRGLQSGVAGQAAQFASRLRELTSLVAERLHEVEGPATGASPGRLAAVGAAAALGALALVFAFTRVAPERGQTVPLQVTLVHGEVVAEPGTRRVTVGDAIESGTTLKTAARSRAHCVTKCSTGFSMGSAAEARVVRVSPDGRRLELELKAGGYIINVADRAEATLTYRKARLAAGPAMFTLGDDPRGGAVLIVDSGTVHVEEPGGSRDVAAGGHSKLE